jgi:hypothetical protein
LGLFGGQNGCGHPSDALRIGDPVDRDDPALDDGEAKDRDRASTDGDDRSGRAVHERGRDQRAGESSGLSGDGFGAAVDDRCRTVLRAEVRPQDDVWVQDPEERVEVAFRAAWKNASTTSR